MPDSKADDVKIAATVHHWLTQDELSAEELALLPERFADIRRPARPHQSFAIPSFLRIAATIAAVIGAAAIFGPTVSAAVQRWLHPAPAPAPVSPPEAKSNAPGGDLPASEYRFAPSGSTVLLRFAAWQPEGNLVVGGSDDSMVVFRVQRRGAEIPLVVLPEGVVVHNSANAAATYQVQVPREVRWIDVEVSGRRVKRIPAPDDASGTVTFDLQSRIER